MSPLLTARSDDVFRIEECARLCCEEHGEERCGGPLNWPHYRDFWIDLIERGDGVIFYHEDEHGMMVGGFGGMLSIRIKAGTGAAKASAVAGAAVAAPAACISLWSSTGST